MNALGAAFLGVVCFVVAGFVIGAGGDSRDPELVAAASYGLVACGLVGVLAGGVAWGMQLARR